MGQLVDRLRASAAAEWEAYVHHPWIEGIRSGDLSPERFQFFLLQDLPYLADFFRIYHMAFAKLRPNQMRAFAPFLQLISTYDEGKFEEELLASMGCRDFTTDLWAVTKAREGYMNHLVRIAHEGSSLEALVAMIPCSMGFCEIGESMQGLDISRHHPAYQRWIEQYRRPFMRQQVNALIAGVEHCASDAPAATIDLFCKIFLRSVQHQVHVFDAAWRLDDPWPGAGSYAWKIVR